MVESLIIKGEYSIFINQKGGDIMQKMILKAGKPDKYSIATACISYLEDKGKYEALLLILDLSDNKNTCSGSEFRIVGKNRAMICKQIREIARVFPPEKDITVIDMQEVLKV